MCSYIKKIVSALHRRDPIFFFQEKYLRSVGALQMFIAQKIYLGRLTIAKPYNVWGTIRFLIDGPGEIRIRKNFHAVSSRLRSYTTLFTPCHLTTIGAGKILIDEGVGLNGTTITAKEEIRIGKRTMIAANTIIMDFDGHSVWPPESRWTDGGAAKSISIEEDVWIGMNCVILKGVRIGKGAIVGPNSVVIHDIDPGCLYAGNPARKIKDYTH